MEEIWKDIEGYEGLYQVSNLGRVKSLEREVPHLKTGSQLIKEKILIKDVGKLGHNRVSLFKGSKVSRKLVHRLVAFAFIPNKEGYPIVMHKVESNPCNDFVENLMWGTVKMNSIDMVKKGRYCQISGKNHWLSSMTGSKNAKSKIVLDTETGIFYDCAKEASEAKEIVYSTLKSKLNGSQKNNTSLIYV